MLIRIGYCITFIMLLSVAGCDWLNSEQDDSKTQRSQPSAGHQLNGMIDAVVEVEIIRPFYSHYLLTVNLIGNK